MSKYDGLMVINGFNEMLMSDSDSEHDMSDDFDITVNNINTYEVYDDSDNDNAIIDDNISDKKPISFDMEVLSDSDVE